MTSKQIVVGVLGIVIGFILGFFTSEAVNRNQAAEPHVHTAQEGAQQAGNQQLPADHPSMEQMQQLEQMQVQAQKDPKDVAVRVALGNAYYDMKRFDAALPWYEQAVELDGSSPDVNTDLGTCYLYTNNPDKAIAIYQKSLVINPKHPQTLQNLGFAYFSAAKFGEAVKEWEKLLAFHPEYPHRDEILKQIAAAKDHLKTASVAK